MKTMPLGIAVLAIVLHPLTGVSLTAEREVTPEFLRNHPGGFSVEAVEGDNGLIAFTITHNVAEPMYHVATLEIFRKGNLIAKSTTPLFGRKKGNVFHFSIAREDLATARFAISDSALSGEAEDAVPLPGTVVYRFRLSAFALE